MIGIIDYNAGNLYNIEKALMSPGEASAIIRGRKPISEVDRAILPGVGSFGDTVSRLRQHGLVDVTRETVDGDTPFLGICLGLQLLFGSGEESGGVEGPGIFPGRILQILDTPGLRIPHMGWNSLDIRPGAMLFRGIDNGAYVYFVHSYYLKTDDECVVAASTEYSTHIHAAVEKERVFVCQLHPERNNQVDLSISKNFLEVQVYLKMIGESYVYKKNYPMSGCE